MPVLNIEQIIKNTERRRPWWKQNQNEERTESHNQGHEECLHGSRHLCGYVISVLNGKLIKLSNIQKYCCSGPFEISVAADLLCILHNKRLVMLSPTSLPKGCIDDQ